MLSTVAVKYLRLEVHSGRRQIFKMVPSKEVLRTLKMLTICVNIVILDALEGPEIVYDSSTPKCSSKKKYVLLQSKKKSSIYRLFRKNLVNLF